MKYLIILFLSSVMFLACSNPKVAKLTSVEQDQCQNEQEIVNKENFAGMTVEGLIFDIKKDAATDDPEVTKNVVIAAMQVRSYCNAKIAFDIDEEYNEIFLRLRNANDQEDDCVCEKQVRVEITDLVPATYNVKVTDATGRQLLADGQFTVAQEQNY